MKITTFALATIVILSCGGNHKPTDSLNLENKLAGKWVAKAFTGELHEEWNLGKDGWVNQKGHYIEKNDTSYSAVTKIEKVGQDLILFSVIKDSNPKIFKSILVKENEIIFENKDYKNPFEVKYEFISENKYRRTIKGFERDSLVTYEFNFKKQ